MAICAMVIPSYELYSVRTERPQYRPRISTSPRLSMYMVDSEAAGILPPSYTHCVEVMATSQLVVQILPDTDPSCSMADPSKA